MKTFIFTLTEQQLGVVFTALGDAPFRVASPVIQTINQQLQQAHDKVKDEQPPSGGA